MTNLRAVDEVCPVRQTHLTLNMQSNVPPQRIMSPAYELVGATCFLVDALVTRKDDIQVQVKALTRETVITVMVNRCDQARVIGVQGQNVIALHVLLNQISASRKGNPVRLTIVEPTFGEFEPRIPYRPDRHWGPSNTMALNSFIEGLLNLMFPAQKIVIRSREDREVPYASIVKVNVPTEVIPVVSGAIQKIVRAAGKNMGRSVKIYVYGDKPDGGTHPG